MTKRDSWEALEDAEKRVDLLSYTLEESRPVPCGAPWAAAIQQLRMFKTHLVALRSRQAPQASGWQPIETAPKDGTEVWLGRKAKRNARHEGWRIPFCHYQDGTWYDDEGLGIPDDPTHWMPLPPAPEKEKP